MSTSEEVTEKGENTSQSLERNKPRYDKPLICAFDLPGDCVEVLEEANYQCYKGSLGRQIHVPNKKRYDSRLCHINGSVPPNLHEYDIVIIDLQTVRKGSYSEEEGLLNNTKNGTTIALNCAYPQTIFDPRAFTAYHLKPTLKNMTSKESILLVFANNNEKIKYEPIQILKEYEKALDPWEYSLFDFYHEMPNSNQITGIKTKVADDIGEPLRSFLIRYNTDSSYNVVFHHPYRYKGNEKVYDNKLIPIMYNESNDIISFLRIDGLRLTFVFPYFSDKQSFIRELFVDVLPEHYSELFPHSTRFAWTSDPAYRLPNEDNFENRRAVIEREYKTKMENLKSEELTNKENYGFLHELITLSGDSLVKTVEKYLYWLEFDEVINMDETDPKLKEEDLRVKSPKGLLLIEVKGIGGTSTDSECSQVSKYVHRRKDELQSFKVYGIYIVNHQRHLPPLKRDNPPFNNTQIEDAKKDKRGLLSTYDLFKLYFAIEKGIISKSDARDALFDIGLVRFAPSNSVFIGTPCEVYHKGYVAIVQIRDTKLSVGMPIIINNNGSYEKVAIQEIQIDGENVQQISNGEIGVKLKGIVAKNAELWKPITA